MPRLLKAKIALAAHRKSFCCNSSGCKKDKDSSSLKRQISLDNETAKTKNIVINYARAIASFTISKLALFYLTPLAEQEKVKANKFQNFIRKMRDTIGGICSFRSLLVVSVDDTPEQISYKKIFRALAEIFIKYFSVNWIMHGRMEHKDVYLKYRFRMLRRIQKPEYFTYLKSQIKNLS